MDFQQMVEIFKLETSTLKEFFYDHINRLESKIEKLTEEKTLMKKDLEDTKVNLVETQKSLEFHCQRLEDELLREKTTEKERKKEEKERNDNKLAEIEDRSRRNNLRFDGFVEEENESPEESESKIKEFVEKTLEIEKEIEIERAHRTGWKTNLDGSKKNRTIIIKLLNYKDKMDILNSYREKKLWNEHVYVNEDFSIKTAKERKLLFNKVKELKGRGIVAKVVYNKLVYSNEASSNEEEINES